MVEGVDRGWRSLALAIVLGFLSPPSRTRIFRQARELLAGGVPPRAVIVYLFSAQTLLVWLLFFIVELDGPPLMIGQLVAVGVRVGRARPRGRRHAACVVGGCHARGVP